MKSFYRSSPGPFIGPLNECSRGRVFEFAFVAVMTAVLMGCSGTIRQADAQRINGKTYVITGASSGFGRGVALELAAQGANVVLAARRTDLLDEIASEAQRVGGVALVVPTDVGDARNVRNLAAAAVQKFGRIDAWINNAGVGVIGPFEDAPPEDYSKLVDTNLKGVIYGSQAALLQFRRQGSGTLVNVGSVDSEVPLAYQAAYSATKAGVLSLGRALNEELRLTASKSIKVATVMPWAADTPWWTHAANYSGHAPRMAAMDDAQKVVAAIVRTAVHPKEEVAVGWKAKASYASHKVLPDLTERLSADISHKEQMELAAPAQPTDGSLHSPMAEGREVEGGVRERMESEDRARESAKPR